MNKEKSHDNGTAIKILRIVFPGVVLLLLGIWFGMGLDKTYDLRGMDLPSARLLEVPVPIPYFSLTDHNGQEFSRLNFRKRWTFMFFGYIYCPDVCPAALFDLDDVYLNLLDKGDLVEQEFHIDTQVVFVSVDPQRDTVEEMKEYTTHFNENFVGITGKPEAIDAFAHPMGVGYRRVLGENAEGDYLIDHSASILLIDPLGRLRATFPPPHAPEQIADDFRKIRKKFTAECCITPTRELGSVTFDYRKEKK